MNLDFYFHWRNLLQMDRFYKYTQQSIWNSELQCVWKLLDWRSQVVNVIWSSDNIVKIICWLPLFGNNQSVWTMKEMFVKRTYCKKNHAVQKPLNSLESNYIHLQVKLMRRKIFKNITGEMGFNHSIRKSI